MTRCESSIHRRHNSTPHCSRDADDEGIDGLDDEGIDGLDDERLFAKNNLQAHRIVTSSKMFLENECRTHRD